MIQILHNSRCGKSRECLALVQNSGVEFQIVKYLENKLTIEELTQLLTKLGISPIELVRIKEPIWISKYKNQHLSDSEIIEAMAENPILIERPVLINGEKAVIARPVEKAAAFLR